MNEESILNFNPKDAIITSAKAMFDTQGYIDIVELAKGEGLDVKASIDTNRSAYIKKQNNNSYTIFVNARDKLSRQRFSIAHEIAHYVLHKEYVDRLQTIDRCGNNSLTPEQESEADELAGELLMPKDVLTNLLCNNYNISEGGFINKEIIQSIADKLKVTFFAMIVRLRTIGYKIPYIALYER